MEGIQRRTVQKDLNEPDYYDGVVSLPESYILECKIKWVLRSTDVNKASGCNEIPAELFKSLKDDVSKVLYSLCQQTWKTQQWPQDWKRSIFIQIPKKGSTKECANHWTTALISHASKVMLKILHARLQHYVNQELPDVQAGLRKGRGTRKQIANICWIIEKAREFQKNIYLCFIDYTKAFDCVDHDKLWKALREMEIPDPLTCILRNLYVRQEATVRTLYGKTDWFKIKKGVQQGCLLSPWLFNLYTAHIMRNAKLGWVTSWNQDRWEKHQQPQIYRWYLSNDRKWRGTKEPPDVGEGGEWKSQFKTKYLKKPRSWHLAPLLYGK